MRLTYRTAAPLAAAFVALSSDARPGGAQPAPGAARRSGFVLTSPDVGPGRPVAARHVANTFGCTGGNVSPALAWRGAPAGTKSYAVTVYDPDAPTGSGWWHWVVYNIPASTTSLPAGAGSGGSGDAAGGGLPAGAAQGNTDYGAKGYGGPCPPPGDRPHRYVFTVYALKVDRIDVPEAATAALVGFNLNANKLAAATFTARYGR
jgi:Raf kinase inhibitor-like YbhB/YbcL family protein